MMAVINKNPRKESVIVLFEIIVTYLIVSAFYFYRYTTLGEDDWSEIYDNFLRVMKNKTNQNVKS